MFRNSCRLAFAAIALAFPLAALAAATVFSKEGDVQSAVAPSTPAPVAERQRIAEGATVTTAGGKAILRFDDGLQVALESDTTLKIVQYRYTDSTAWTSSNRTVLELQRGAIRVVTGWMVFMSPASFTLRAPQAEIVPRGPADFTVALVNPMYLSVQVGSLVTSNATGKLALAEGSRVLVASANAVPRTILASELPASTAATMQNLQVAGLTTPGAAAAGALPTTAGVATGGVGAGTGAIAVGVGLAGAAAASSGGDAPSSTTHH